jgi:hypothetical protein
MGFEKPSFERNRSMRIQNSVDIGDQVVGQILDIRQITTAQLAQLGVSQLAYIKHINVGGETAVAIHGADGTPMGVAPNQELAWEAILEHEMVPTLVQ